MWAVVAVSMHVILFIGNISSANYTLREIGFVYKFDACNEFVQFTLLVLLTNYSRLPDKIGNAKQSV